ncbi:MAG TPA: YigZ family protein [Saprospiraceae bacterium]|nr:YigZ family protein [Saprospiraceae bacterium]
MKNPHFFELTSKGSKFIAYSFHVTDKQQIDSRTSEIKNMHPKARHWCYAWKTGISNIQSKAFDDGEPAGSAGKPILNQIESFRLTQCLVIVVRYFGGTLLGLPGLVKAYKESSWNCLDQSEKLEILIRNRFYYSSSFEKIQSILSILKSIDVPVCSFEFGEPSYIAFEIPIKDESLWFSKINSKLEKKHIGLESKNYQIKDCVLIKNELII